MLGRERCEGSTGVSERSDRGKSKPNKQKGVAVWVEGKFPGSGALRIGIHASDRTRARHVNFQLEQREDDQSRMEKGCQYARASAREEGKERCSRLPVRPMKATSHRDSLAPPAQTNMRHTERE